MFVFRGQEYNVYVAGAKNPFVHNHKEILGLYPPIPYNKETLEELRVCWGEYHLSKVLSGYDYENQEDYSVLSASGNSYTVTLMGKLWSCTCDGYLYRGNCSHITSVREYLERETSHEAESV